MLNKRDMILLIASEVEHLALTHLCPAGAQGNASSGVCHYPRIRCCDSPANNSAFGLSEAIRRAFLMPKNQLGSLGLSGMRDSQLLIDNSVYYLSMRFEKLQQTMVTNLFTLNRLKEDLSK